MDDRLTAFARALETEMARARLNQTELAAGAGLSQGVISSWLLRKTTNPEPRGVFAVERVLGLPPGRLSRHLGFMPVEACDEPVVDVVYAIEHDSNITDDLDRKALLMHYSVVRARPAD